MNDTNFISSSMYNYRNKKETERKTFVLDLT